MRNEQIVAEAADYVRELFQGNSDGHGLAHTMRVYRTAMRLADGEPACDRLVVALAALLHDADDYKLFSTEDNAHARAFLNSHGISPETADRVLAAVNAVSFHKNKGKKPETPEGQIVQDADRLDAIGAVGIARTFAFGGKHGRPPEESIAHFHEKLLLLKELMNTAGARALAEQRHRFMEDFLREWAQETGEEQL